MPERSWQWVKRITWGEGRAVPLDFGMELWKWDVSLYESAEGIRAAMARAGKPLDDDAILYEATRSLLADVVDAAGGAEQAHQRFRDAVEAIKAQVARWADSDSSVLSDGMGLVDPTVEAAWYALEELLVWARVLSDRLKRKPVIRGYRADQGLIPALAGGPRRDALVAARARLLQGGVEEATNLSNLSLHMQSSQTGSRIGRVRSGEIILPFPDRVTTRIGHRWQLTYDAGRDAVTFADSLMGAIERFMEEMITTLEAHVPERFRTE
ncbi:hypothetical protein [Amycolatopsis sp. cmx-4-68]|uniref:hypothetical protein n=1 Tax=Amycolatopsis sp. cmx-4-68 TaxID=2790938 RepID=UPI00397B06DF